MFKILKKFNISLITDKTSETLAFLWRTILTIAAIVLRIKIHYGHIILIQITSIEKL